MTTPNPLSALRRRRFAAPALAALLLVAAAAVAAIGPARDRPAGVGPELRYAYPPTPPERTLDGIEQAIAFYRERSLARPGDGLDLAALADAYLAKARVSGYAPWYLLAEQNARRSIANLPFGNVEARLVLAEVAEARHGFDEALALADGVLAERPGHPRALALKATVLLARGDPAEAETVATALVATRPTPAALGLLGVVQAAQARDAEATGSLEAAVALEERGDPRTSAWLRTQLARLELRRGRLADAEPLLAEALRIVPGYPPAQLEMATVRLAQGRYRAAERGYADLLAASADATTTFDHAALQGMARARALRGDRTGAEALWLRAETTLRADRARDAFGHDRELARLLLERGRSDDLAEAIALLRAETARRRDAATLDLLAWALTRDGRLDEARAVAAEALALGATPLALERAARVALAAGDANASERHRARLAALAPDVGVRVRHALDHGD